MGKEKSRKAGDKLKDLYGGAEEYGNWSDTWQTGVAQQQLKASGTYDADSDLAKKFATLNTDGKSRVDDEEGWSELKWDKPIQSAEDYEELVKKWSAAGFDVRAIDMKTKDGRKFGNSNLAVRIAKPGGGGDDGGDGGGASTGSGGVAQNVTGNIGAGANSFLSPTQNVNQDNDIINTISGNNNNVTNNQDNSVSQTTIDNSNNSRYYGGSNRYMSYGAGSPVAPDPNPFDMDPQSPVTNTGPIATVNEGDFLNNFMKGRFADKFTTGIFG